jgi:membrane-associated phospholipid phosphatase
VNSLVVDVAQYGIFVVAAGALVVWLLCSRQEKVALAVQAVVTMIVVAVLVKVAGTLHTDPRPFVVNPHLHPLFPHPADNGFPSDHTALASGIAFLVTTYRRWIGLALVVVSVGIGASRVAAHVHHPQDIAAGLVIGLLAALLGWLSWRAVGPRVPGSRTPEVERVPAGPEAR